MFSHLLAPNNEINHFDPKEYLKRNPDFYHFFRQIYPLSKILGLAETGEDE
jgi:hypothetical protein